MYYMDPRSYTIYTFGLRKIVRKEQVPDGTGTGTGNNQVRVYLRLGIKFRRYHVLSGPVIQTVLQRPVGPS